MIKKVVIMVCILFLLLPNLMATSSVNFTDDSSFVFLVDTLHTALGEEIAIDLNKTFSSINKKCHIINCNSSILKQKWLIENELQCNQNLEYLIVFPLSYYGFESIFQKVVDKHIHLVILENDVHFDQCSKFLIPWQQATTSLLEYVAQKDLQASSFIEIQGNMLSGTSSAISTVLKQELQKHQWKLHAIVEDCPTRSLGFKQALFFYRNVPLDDPSYYFIHTNEATRGFLDVKELSDAHPKKILSLDINDAIKKGIFCHLIVAGIDYHRNYGKRIISLLQDNIAKNQVSYLGYEVVSQESMNE